jgi:CHASE2 domain-containing sensor protein/serine/threonine protein kinase
MQASTHKLSEDNLRRGFRLDNYALLERIGFGGEAEIWSAWDEERQRVTVIKFIRLPTFDPILEAQINQDFAKQIQLVATLKHPHILRIYGHGSLGKQFHYFVMRYAPMGSLAGLLQAGPLSLRETLAIVGQIVAALTFLHERGIVHRDLKPNNILLDSQRRGYLSDFGLAKELSSATLPMHTGRGTQAYAPFEQHNRLAVVPQSDIYSLGILIFEMLTGELPWAGTNDLASQQFQFDDRLPDLSDYAPALPIPLTAALHQLTAFHWAERPSTAQEAFELLTTAVDASPADFLPKHPAPDDLAIDRADAHALLEQFTTGWLPETTPFPASLSHLALIDSVRARDALAFPTDPDQELFLLRGALAHNYPLVSQPQPPDAARQWSAAAQTIRLERPSAIARALAQMDALTAPAAPDSLTLGRLLELATTADAPEQEMAWRVLQRVAPRPTAWQTVGISAEMDGRLAEFVLADEENAPQAARLIGQIRSTTAVTAILAASPQPGRLSPPQRTLLSEIQRAAGGLPPETPARIRWQVRAQLGQEWLRRDRHQQPLSRAAIGLLVALLVGLMMQAGWLQRPSAQLRDSLLEPYLVSNIVTIVGVDDDSLARFGRWDSWPRSLHAQLLEQLQAMGASVVVFDFLFESVTPDDDALSQAMQSFGNVVQPVLGSGDALHITPGQIAYQQLFLPQPALLAASAAIGHTNILHDKDGLVRRLPTLISAEDDADERYPSLAISALQRYLGLTEPAAPALADTLAVIGREIPVTAHGEMLIYYAGVPTRSEAATFTVVSYQDVLDGRVAPELLRGKIVLVGMMATAEPDRYLTPVSNGRPMYGVEIMANAIETIWSGKFIREAKTAVTWAIILVLGLMAGLLAARPWSGLLLTAGLGFLYFLAAIWLFSYNGTLLDLFFPLTAILATYVMVTAYHLSIEARRREALNKKLEIKEFFTP